LSVDGLLVLASLALLGPALDHRMDRVFLGAGIQIINQQGSDLA
jgi:hypothetical protein